MTNQINNKIDQNTTSLNNRMIQIQNNNQLIKQQIINDINTKV